MASTSQIPGLARSVILPAACRPRPHAMPRPDLIGIPGQDIITLADADLNRSVSPGFSRVNVTAKFPCNDMKTQTDPKDRDPGDPGTPHIHRLARYPVRRRELFHGTLLQPPLRECVGDQRHIDIQIPEGTVDQVIELAVIIDHTDGKHCYKSIGLTGY